MLSGNILDTLASVCREVTAREGFCLYDFEFVGSGKNRTLRIYIDSENGVSIDDCSNVSKALNLRLDVEDIIPGGAYHLEVSSPGVERRLRTVEHFEQAVGHEIVFKLKKPLGDYGLQQKSKKRSKQARALLKEILDATTGDGQEAATEGGPQGLRVELGEELLVVPLGDVEKANMYFDFAKQKKKGSAAK